jgi:hypothetical protein
MTHPSARLPQTSTRIPHPADIEELQRAPHAGATSRQQDA